MASLYKGTLSVFLNLNTFLNAAFQGSCDENWRCLFCDWGLVNATGHCSVCFVIGVWFMPQGTASPGTTEKPG